MGIENHFQSSMSKGGRANARHHRCFGCVRTPRNGSTARSVCYLLLGYSTGASQGYRKAGSPSLSVRSEEHTSELQSRGHLVCRLLLEKKNKNQAVSNEDHR